VTTVAQHVTVALKNRGASRVYGLPGDSLERRANELLDVVTTHVARRIFE
jgi:thiamine pyrophosphate-dependent acetolactate synthase large subunit-like protein